MERRESPSGSEDTLKNGAPQARLQETRDVLQSLVAFLENENAHHVNPQKNLAGLVYLLTIQVEVLVDIISQEIE